MFENITNFFKKLMKIEKKDNSSKDTAKERLHLVLMQDRANVSADFLELMKQEIIEVIKKYIEIDEKEIDVRLTNKENDDGTNGAPALYANIPILNIRNDMKKEVMKEEVKQEEKEVVEPKEVVAEEKNEEENAVINEAEVNEEVNAQEETRSSEESEAQNIEKVEEQNESEKVEVVVQNVEEKFISNENN